MNAYSFRNIPIFTKYLECYQFFNAFLNEIFDLVRKEDFCAKKFQKEFITLQKCVQLQEGTHDAVRCANQKIINISISYSPRVAKFLQTHA